MTLVASPRAAGFLPWLRFLALLPISLLVGHDAVFAFQFGWADNFRLAMTGGGHDGYWMAFSLVIVTLTAGVLAREAIRALLLARRIGGQPWNRVRQVRDRGFLREFRSIWPGLFVATCAAFTIQENLEHIAAGLAPHGLGSLIGAEHPYAVPVLAVVSAMLGAVGALIRWRIRILESRIAPVAHRPPRRGPLAIGPARDWPAIGALRLHAWFLVRLDAGRAPPAGA